MKMENMDIMLGDVFIYPKNIEHEIENNSDEEHEYIFVRIKE